MLKLFLLLLCMTLINFQKNIFCDNIPSFTFVILRDPQQDSVSKIMQNVLKKIETDFENRIKLIDKEVYSGKTRNLNEQVCQVVSNGTTAIIDLTLEGYYKELAFLHHSILPYFHIDITSESMLEAMDLYVNSKSGYDTVFIINKNEEELDVVLSHIITKSKLRTLTIQGLDDETLRKIKSIKPYPSYFSILGKTSELIKWFGMLQEANMIKVADKWHFMFTDFDYDSFDFHLQHPNISRLIMNKTMCCNYMGKNPNCVCSNDFNLPEAHLHNVLKSIIHVLFKSNHIETKYDCNQLLSNDSLIENNGVISSVYSKLLETIYNNPLIFIDDGNNMTIRYKYEIQIFTAHGQHSHQKIATVEDSKFLLGAEKTLKPTKRYFRVGIVEAAPWSYIIRDNKGKILIDDKSEPIWDGYCVEFAQKLAERMDFDFEWVIPKSGRFGTKYSDGRWDGLIGDLYKGDTDMVVAPLKMTAQREEVIDFVTPFFEQTGILILMRNPVIETSLFKFMTVLRLEVWLSIIAALVATSVMLWLLDTYSPYSSRNNRKAYPYSCREFTLKESFWFTLTSFTPQGGGEAPKSLSARTLVAAYWLFVVLMLATFTANLAAFLTVERMKTPVQSLEQLARQSRINYTVVEESDTHQYFINMKFAEDTLYRMWKEITLNSSSDELQYRVWEYPIKEQYGNILLAINDSMPVRTSEEGYKKVNEAINADFAFIHDAAEIRYQIARNCNFTQVGEIFAEQPYALAIQQGSHIHDELSKTIIELQHERFFELLTAKYWNNSLKGYCPNSDESEGITLESLGGVFIATLFGLGLAMLTLVGEVIYHRKLAQKDNVILQVKPFNDAIPHTPSYNAKVHPSPPTYAETVQKDNGIQKSFMFKNRKENKNSPVTLGEGDFVPVTKKYSLNPLFKAGGNSDLLE